MAKAVRVSTVIERHTPELPRYVIIPAEALAAWKLGKETTAVDVLINGSPVERRTIKYWDEARWFLSITAKDCKQFEVDTGDRLDLEMRVADTALPTELEALIASDPRAKAAWLRMTKNQQRMLREEVSAAKRTDTRALRSRRALLGD